MQPTDLVRIAEPHHAEKEHSNTGSTRQWLTHAQPQLAHLLTARGKLVMQARQMRRSDGRPTDVYAYFNKNPAYLSILTKNWFGIVHTAQAVSRSLAIDQPAPPWPNFHRVWIPVADGVELAGRLGFAQDADGNRSADCIVLLPGMYGDNGVQRTKDLAEALRNAGFHVLALELRGHGQTELQYPDVYYTFGLLDTQDLIRVSEWLEDEHAEIRRTGLIGFCWGGNLGLLAAWFDSRPADDQNISPNLARYFDPPTQRTHFTAGIMAFSPVLRWEEIMDLTDVEHDVWINPSAFFFQETVRSRMKRKGFPEISGNLRRLIAYELAHSEITNSIPISQCYRFLRLLPYRGQSSGDKLEYARVPVLMVTSVNDPFLSAQDLADLTATTDNPLVASLITRGGGHIGFAPYNRAYFYSLIINFFDPKSGAAASASKLNQN